MNFYIVSQLKNVRNSCNRNVGLSADACMPYLAVKVGSLTRFDIDKWYLVMRKEIIVTSDKGLITTYMSLSLRTHLYAEF